MAQRLKIAANLHTRAAFAPDTFDPAKGTVEVVFTTGARGKRNSFWDGPYFEELEVSEAAIDLTRLNNGASVLNAHGSCELEDVIGVVERAWISGSEGRATLRFSDREDVKPIRDDVQGGILRHISVGYSIQKLEKIEELDGVPVYRATRWTPAEISLVPIAFDDGAVVRAADPHPQSYEVDVVDLTHRNKEPIMEPETNPAGGSTPAAPAVAAPAPVHQAADPVRAERERITGIMQVVQRAKLPGELATRLIGEGVTLDAARATVLDELATRDSATTTTQHVRVEGGTELRRAAAIEGMTNALLHRTAPSQFKLEPVGREFRSARLLELARESLALAGINTRGMSSMEVAGLALGLQTRAGFNSTSDFPLILADVANKTLRQAYTEAPQTFQAFSRRTTLPDFKPVKRTQLGEAPQLKKVLEGGEFTRGAIGEGKEQYQLATYGRVFAITRQALVNDDMDAFSRVPALFGRAARDLESDLVWEQITSNPTMGDAVALFHATHGNLAGAGAVISIATIGAGRTAMRQQKGVDKKQFVNVAPKFLVVPAALETIADQFVSQNMLANASGSVNPFGGRLSVIAEPRLDAASLTAWYLFAEAGQVDIVEYAYLDGEEGPTIESRIGFDVDGLEIKARHDFAAKVIDYRGVYRNPGA